MNEEIRKKIQKIIIYTKRVMRTSLAGDYISAFKGSGLEFDQLREYQLGDDIRFIDWNSCAKTNKIMIKQLIEERDRTVILAIDVSRSAHFSSQQELKKETMAQVAASLSFVASNNKDRVGALFFSDRVEKWIAPTRSRAQYGKIIETIFSLTPHGRQTDIAQALRFLIGLKKRNAIVFFLSDWIDQLDTYSKLLKVASCEYDFIGIRFLDACEHALPDVGMLDMVDAETGVCVSVDTRASACTSSSLNTYLGARVAKQRQLFDSYRMGLLDLPVGKPFVAELVRFFHARTRRQI